MQYDRLVSGLAGVLGAITVVMAVLGVVYNPAILFVALTFAVSTYFVYYHASGRLAARVYRSVERQAATGAGGERRHRTRRRGGFDAGPRQDWRPPRDGATAREAAFGGRGGRQRQRQTSQRRTRQRQRVQPARGPSTAEAYRTLGLDPNADDASIKRAYREKVKEVHPDAEGGDEERFKEVTAAYDRLTD